ncbi:MAG: lactate racemase domain-containing protein [Oscillospiraceae bacterium]|nr:lactate racemase domain-containing protein [Oscillospiraceae bacterium]
MPSEGKASQGVVAQSVYAEEGRGIGEAALRGALRDCLADIRGGLQKVLLLVPDYTRLHSGAGQIANILYRLLADTCRVDILPALGTHAPMTRDECGAMYGDIPLDRFLVHNWRTDVVSIGRVPAAFVHEVSEGVLDEAIDVEVNRRLYDGYDLILSIGQVIPHEVVGMANHTKNIFVGCGGSAMINASHILGAFYGMERIMGRDHSPVRKVFDYAAEHFLRDLPIAYVLTVTTAPAGEIRMHGLFIGRGRGCFERAVALAQRKNLMFVDHPLQKAVVYLNEREFKSTWLGNKAIYRTRMALADGGELIVLAPGVETFGEDAENDRLIRKYGYCGRENIIRLCKTQADLRANLSAAAHLIHGSADGRFQVTYCTRRLTREQVEGVRFGYMPYGEAAARYDPERLQSGMNTLADGEAVFFIPNPALGLWADKGNDRGEAWF